MHVQRRYFAYKTYCFLTFSLPSASLDLNVPISVQHHVLRGTTTIRAHTFYTEMTLAVYTSPTYSQSKKDLASEIIANEINNCMILRRVLNELRCEQKIYFSVVQSNLH